MADLARFAPAALLGVGCLLISGVREQQQLPPRRPIPSIPIAAPAGYQARDIEVPEAERKVAGMSHYVMRAFQRDSLDPGFSVYIGYYDYQVQGKSIHSPKNCLPGAGWEAVENGTRTFAAADGRPVTVNRYFAANTERRAQALVYYWYAGRGRVEANEYAVKWHLLRDAALYGRTEEALVRLVVPIVTPPGTSPERTQAALAAARASADSLATGLARQLVPDVAAALPAAPRA